MKGLEGIKIASGRRLLETNMLGLLGKKLERSVGRCSDRAVY